MTTTTAGRPKRIKFDPTKIKPPKLISVYRLHYPGYELVSQYYKYDFIEADSDHNPYIESCPGCGRELKYTHLDHKCPGTKLPNPVNNRMGDFKLSKKQQEQKFKAYLSQQTHPIHLTD